MKERTFHRLLAAVIIAGIIISLLLLIYTKHLYDNCSIISYIAKGR